MSRIQIDRCNDIGFYEDNGNIKMIKQQQMGSKIRNLRKWLRLSQTLVGEYLGISKSAVSALESGRAITVEEVRKLSLLFRCDPNSLFGLDLTPVDSLDLKFETRLNNTQNIANHDLKEIENLSQTLKQVVPFGTLKPPQSISRSTSPQKAAEDIGTVFDCSTPVDIYSLLILVGLYPRFSALEGLAGALVRVENSGATAYGVLINSDQPEERMRFSAAHELGHYLLGHLASEESYHASLKSQWRNSKESDADAFAATLLMPRSHIEQWFLNAKNIDEFKIVKLADQLQVSYQAILHRLLELGCIARLEYDKYSKLKPTEIKQQLQLNQKVKEKNFQVKVLDSLYSTLHDSFKRTPDSIRWMQEAAYSHYCTTTKLDNRTSDVKEVYEAVALWMADKHSF